MSTLDEFESRFRAAQKPLFKLSAPTIRRIAVVTDLPRSDPPASGPFAEAGGTQASFLAAIQADLQVLGDDVTWIEVTHDDYQGVEDLLERIDAVEPDLIVAYRNLKDGSWRWPYSLGCFLNVLTRETAYPVLIVPNPNEVPSLNWRKAGTDNVMVITDHLAGDVELVNWGVRLTAPQGTLWLTHIEDDGVFERYMGVIGRIPSIPTDEARAAIHQQLLKEPAEYIASTRTALMADKIPIQVESIVQAGHQAKDYRELVENHQVDLLCFHATSSEECALHGASYLLAVELRSLPILML